MSINQRQHIRFSLDIPATLVTAHGERQETTLQQISIGGCFTDWDENIYTGDEFRVEVDLPNGNALPLRGKAVYRFENTGIGVRFVDINEFEQRLISKIVAHHFERHGVPLPVDPFKIPSKFIGEDDNPAIVASKRESEKLLADAMSTQEVLQP